MNYETPGASALTLPKSGVVLEKYAPGRWIWNATPFFAQIQDHGSREEGHDSREKRWYADCSLFLFMDSDSQEEVVAWLDSRVLALRAALTPPDARERIARALEKDLSGRTRWWNSVDSDIQEEIVATLTSRVLSALGMAP